MKVFLNISAGKCRFFLILLSIASSQLLFAGKSSTYTWNGGTSDWEIDANWSSAPGSGSGTQIYEVGGPGTYTNAPIISTTPGDDIDFIDLFDGCSWTVSSGTVEVDVDLLIRAGADVTLSGGTVNVLGDVHLYDDGSSLTVSGGTLNVTGVLYLGLQQPDRADGTDGSPQVTVSSGAINATTIVFDDEEGDTPAMSISGGTVSATDLRSDGAAVNITISSSGTLDIANELQMDGGSDILTMSDGNLEVAGDWTNAGSTSLTGGTITFNGSAAQQITNTSGESFYNLVINNTSTGVTLNDPVTITNTLTLTDGVVTSSSSNTITLNDDVTVSGASSASFVDGPISKIGNEAFNFPVGDGSTYLPLSISAPSSATDQFTAQYFNTNPNPLYNILNLAGGLSNVSSKEYWNLDRNVGSSNVTVTLSWDANSAVGDLTDLRVGHWGGAQWGDEGNTGTTGNITAGTISSSSVSSFSPFTLASTSLSNPLPVELLWFDAQLRDEAVEVAWETATEINCSHYEIQRSQDGLTAETIARINTKATNGNSTERLSYQFIDFDQLPGNTYYRLKQVDLDGQFKLYDYKVVKRAEKETPLLLYPNPVTESNVRLLFFGKQIVRNIWLSDIKGNRQALDFEQDESGYRLELPSALASGSYYLQLLGENGQVLGKSQIVVP